LKKIVFITLLISFAFSLSISYQQTKNDEIEKLATIEKEFATPFILPKDEDLDAESTYPLLRTAAKEANVNIFRAGRYYRPDQQVEMLKYIMLTGDTRFFDHVEITSGRTLQIEETQNSSKFISSFQTQERYQVGKIDFFDPNQLITIKSLETSYDYLPVHGRYFVEADDEKKIQLFLQTLSDYINTYLQSKDEERVTFYSTADFQPPEAFVKPREGFFALTSVYDYRFEQFILFAATILLLVYYIFNASQRVGILKMHGVSNLRLWWLTVGQLIATAMIITVIGSVVFAMGLYKPTPFIFQTFKELGLALLILVLLSLLCYGYLVTIPLSQALKNRKDTRAIFLLNIGLKVICAASLILMGLETFQHLNSLRSQQERMIFEQGRLNQWKEMQGYGVVEAYRGHTTAYTVDELSEEDSAIDSALYDLYPSLNALGSLYIDASDYEVELLLSNPNYNGILYTIVNPNYLNKFPMYDENGAPVKISEEDKNWVTLVPEQYRDRENEIRNFFERDEQRRDFFLTKDVGQEMRIIWLKKGQYLFSFNPNVFPMEQNKVLDPIIHVKTEKNHLFTYRSGITGGGLTDSLKLKLIDQDPARTYEEIEPDLKRLKIDNIIRIISFKEYFSAQIADLQEQIRYQLLVITVLSGIFTFLIIQSLIIFFHRHQNRLVINRLFGIGFFRTYRIVFGWWGLTTLLMIILGYGIDQSQEPPFQMINGITDTNFLIVVFSLLGLEFIVTWIALAIMERRNHIQVIKKGD
jgi:putative ABC transport system permease protein